MGTLGINTDVLNERLLKASELLKPLGIHILCEERPVILRCFPKGMVIDQLTVTLEFSEPEVKKEELDSLPKDTGHPDYGGVKLC